MTASDLESHLREAFPDADIELIALAGDDDHWKAVVSSAAFAGKTRVAQHQMVYAALKGKMGGVLHALALETRAK
jgi:stress-induced morphogen